MPGKKRKMEGGGRRRKTARNEKEEKEHEHPLMNHVVMESICNYLSVKHLKVVRQVCTLWRDCGRKKWFKSVSLKIQGPSIAPYYKQFFQLVAGDKQIRMQGTSSNGNWMIRFCAQVKALELVDVYLPTIKSLRSTLFLCFPNLEHLTLGTINIEEAGTVYEPIIGEPMDIPIEDQQRNLKSLKVVTHSNLEIPLSWMEVFAHFPSLEAINMSSFRCKRTHAIFQAINKIREEDPSKLDLKHVSIMNTDFGWSGGADTVPAAFTTLLDRRLHLETLEMRGLATRRSVTTFLEILQIHAGTLKNLGFAKIRVIPFLKDLEFTELNKLEKLEVHTYCSLESLAVLQFTPNLKKLSLQQGNHPDYLTWAKSQRHTYHDLDSFNFPVTLSTCKELQIRKTDVDLPFLSLETLVEWMPDLEVLKVDQMDNAGFALLCEHLTSLVELHVGKSRVDSSGITGWTEKDLALFDSLSESEQPPVAWNPDVVPRLNITRLKDLQILSMSAVKTSKIQLFLSRAAGLHGIEMLPNLRRLQLQNYKIKPEDRNYWKEQHKQYLFSV